MATGRVPTTANSPLTAKGDLFGYSTTQARVAVGNNGETLVADSSTSTGLRWQGNYAAGKNKIINGDFNIWQRGTSFTGTGQYAADRFYTESDGNGTFAFSRQTFTPGTAPVAGYEGQYFMRLGCTTVGTTTRMDLHQKIEDVRTLAGQTATISFWAKADTTRTLNAWAIQVFGGGGSADVYSGLNSQPFTITSSWQRFSYTFSIPSISGKTIGTNSYLIIILRYAPASGSSMDIWGLQLEAGNTATAFQTATGTLAGELAACQRYFYRFGGEDVYNHFCPVYFPTTATGYGIVQFPVTMRTAPAVSQTVTNFAFLYGNNTITACTATNYLDRITKQNFRINNSVAGTPLTAGNAGVLVSNNTTNGYFDISAEL